MSYCVDTRDSTGSTIGFVGRTRDNRRMWVIVFLHGTRDSTVLGVVARKHDNHRMKATEGHNTRKNEYYY